MSTTAPNHNQDEEEVAVEVERVLLVKLQAGIDSNTPWSNLFTGCKELLEKKLDSSMDRKARARFRRRVHLLTNLLNEHDSVFDNVNIAFGYRLKQIMDDIKLDPKPDDDAATAQAKKRLIESQTERVPSRASTAIKSYGFDVDLMAAENLLLCRGVSPEFNAVGIYGAEGVGKTTLAQIIFHSEKVRSTFLPRIWICLTDLDLHFFAKQILLQLGFGREIVNTIDQSAIRPELLHKKYLIVLDGVPDPVPDPVPEDADYYVRLMRLLREELPMGSGGAVMVTGRSESVVKEMVGGSKNAVHRVLPLEKPVLCWDIYKAATEEGEKEEIADADEKQKLKNEVVKRSDGLPWASTLMGILRREIKLRPRRSTSVVL